MCVIVLHNWFSEKRLGIVLAGWLSALYLQKVL